MTLSYFLGKFKNGPFWPNLGHFYLKFSLYIACGFQLNQFILPKKHSLITQKQFWPCFGVFSGFLGVPQNYIFWSFKSVF